MDIEQLKAVINQVSKDQTLIFAIIQFLVLFLLMLGFYYFRKSAEKLAEVNFEKALEEFKAELSKEQWIRSNNLDEFLEIRKETAAAGKSIMHFLHKMVWYSWKAKFTPEEIDTNLIKEYDDSMKPLFPEMLGNVSRIASLDKGAYESLKEIEKELLDYDGMIALTIRKIDKDRDTTIMKLSKLYDDLNKLESDGNISQKIWNTLNLVRERYYNVKRLI